MLLPRREVDPLLSRCPYRLAIPATSAKVPPANMFFRKKVIEEPVTGLLLSRPGGSAPALVEWAISVRDRLIEVARSRTSVGHRIDLTRGWVRISAPNLEATYWRELAIALLPDAGGELFLYRLSDSGTEDRLEQWREGQKPEVLRGAMSPFQLGAPAPGFHGRFDEWLSPLGIHSRADLHHEEPVTHAAPPLPVVAAFVEVLHTEPELRSSVHDALTGIDAEPDVLPLRDDLLLIDPGVERIGLTAPLARVSMLGGVRRLHALVHDEGESSYEGYWTATNGAWTSHAFLEHEQDLDFLRLRAAEAPLRDLSQHVWREWPLCRLTGELRFGARRALVESHGALARFDRPFPPDVPITAVPVRYALGIAGLEALDEEATRAGASISSLLEKHLERLTQEDLTRTLSESATGEAPKRELTVFLRPLLHKRLGDTAKALDVTPSRVLQGAIDSHWKQPGRQE